MDVRTLGIDLAGNPASGLTAQKQTAEQNHPTRNPTLPRMQTSRVAAMIWPLMHNVAEYGDIEAQSYLQQVMDMVQRLIDKRNIPGADWALR